MLKVGVISVVWCLPMLTYGFFHQKSADTYSPTLLESSLFGYSLEYMTSQKSLIVSAPNEDVLGRIFEINLKNKTISQLNIKPDLRAKDDRGVWLGASLKAVNDSLVVCAPRFTLQYKGIRSPRIEGTCYESESSLQEFHQMPRREVSEDQLKNYDNYYNNVIFGWSLETTREGRLLVGGPGGKGDVIKYDSLYSTPHYINSQTPLQNLGYSIVCGNFSKEITCAVSSTYGTRGYGMVFLYDASFHQLCVVRDERHVGAMFGASLSRVDLGAGHHHLLVGAPLSRTGFSTYDVGAVHLYVKDPLDDTTMVFVKRIQGSHNGGYFGNTILSMGDMDGDGKDEVAIAAPYENELRGAVYIYTGAVLGAVNSGNQPAQVIRPENLQYFGLSMALVGDFDDNGCNDLAVGAPESNTVVVYKSFASVKIDIDVHQLGISESEREATVTFETCLRFTYPEYPTTVKGDVRYHVGILNGIYQYDVQVPLNKTQLRSCHSHIVPLETADLQILMYEVKDISLKQDPRDLAVFDPTRVLISSDSVLYKTGQFSFSNCSGVCNPVLNVTVTTSMPNNEYAIGSSESEWFSMDVTNHGYTAYASCVEVEVIGATILKPGPCSFKEKDSGRRIVCTPRRALRNGSSWKIEKVLLEMSGMTSNDETLELRYDVLDRCDKPDKKQTHSLKISLLRDHKFTITGFSSPDSKVNFTRGYASNGVRSISHVYKIQNNGLTNWVGLKSRISLPKVEYVTYEIFFQSDGISRVCLTGDELSRESVVCSIGNVYRDRSTSVYVNVKVAPEMLGLVEKTEEFRTLTTSLQLLFEDNPTADISQSITTTFQLQYAEVALWIIIVAVCVGLLILLLITFALYKCGFLRRQKKERLQNLRKSVYRQSMVRSRRLRQSGEGSDVLITEEDESKDEPEQNENHNEQEVQ